MKNKILDIAQRLVQERGINGFSYADVAKEVGVAKASLHHHFATKSDLVSHLIERYSGGLSEHLQNLSASSKSPTEKLVAFCNVYRASRECNRVCMGGILSAESAVLADVQHAKLKRFFDSQCEWLVGVLDEGVNSQEFLLYMSPERQARAIVTSLQGALMVSQTAVNNDYFDDSVSSILASVSNQMTAIN